MISLRHHAKLSVYASAREHFGQVDRLEEAARAYENMHRKYTVAIGPPFTEKYSCGAKLGLGGSHCRLIPRFLE